MEKIEFSTIDAIITDILQLLSQEYQEKIKEMSIEDFRTIDHFNLGQWIRNKYFYQNPAQEHLVKSLSDPKEYVFLDGDKFSHIILEKLYERITTVK